jgi:hypothetical protein
MLLGCSLLTLILLDTIQALPLNLLRSWYTNRPIWCIVGLGFCVAGWNMQRIGMAGNSSWRPTTPGRRFSRLIVYSRRECHLCDDVKAVLHQYLDYLPAIDDVDIDLDPELQGRFGDSVPVVEIDGVVRFRGHINEILLRRLIEATTPD